MTKDKNLRCPLLLYDLTTNRVIVSVVLEFESIAIC